MGEDQLHPAVARILREQRGADLLDALGAGLTGADLSALLLEVMRRRAAATTPAAVLRRYEEDRFAQPATVDAVRLLDLERRALEVLAPRFTPIVTSPLVPLGTHASVAGVHQNRLVSTIRGSEVAADPTTSLALEAAVQRRRLLAEDPRSSAVVRLAAVDRVVRAQQVDGPRSFAHFSLLGLVSAAREAPGGGFAVTGLREHLRALVAVTRALLGAPSLAIRLTDFGGRHARVVDALVSELAEPGVVVNRWPERTAAQGYYPSVCFKLDVIVEGEAVEVGDGGLVDWAQGLVGSGRERMMTSGLGLERLVLLATAS